MCRDVKHRYILQMRIPYQMDMEVYSSWKEALPHLKFWIKCKRPLVNNWYVIKGRKIGHLTKEARIKRECIKE